MGFRENLKAEMEYKGMRTQELADKAGVNKRTIDHYLMTNPQEPSVTNAFKIASALNVSVEYLVTGIVSFERQSTAPLSRDDADVVSAYLVLPPRQRAVVSSMVRILAEQADAVPPQIP